MAGASVLSGRRGLVAAVVALLVGGVGVLVVAQASWVHVSSGGQAISTRFTNGGLDAVVVDLTVKGSQAVPVLVPLALLSLAGVVGLVATRGVLRRAVGGLLVLCGLGLVGAAVGLLMDPASVVPAALRDQSLDPGLADGVSTTVTPAWPLVAAVSGVLVVGAGALAAGWSRRWPAMGARFEAPTGGPRPGRPDDTWTALDRGEDPTVDPAPAPAEREVPE
jgi:uncharacterized membrane protein (TIGR02234 family)